MATLKMTKKKYSGLDGRTYVKLEDPNGFSIIASPSGVRMSGEMIAELETHEDFAKLAQIIGEAATEYSQLRKAALQDISRPS